MKLKFIDFPYAISVDEYKMLLDRITKILLLNPAIKGVYSIGSVKNPGISDLDILCVFKNNSQTSINIRNLLSDRERKILTHEIFGVYFKDLDNTIKYNYITNIRLISGSDLPITIACDDRLDEIAKQIAIEYLLKMYITLDVQIKNGLIKLRPFLLEAKALKYDLLLLNLLEDSLANTIEEVVFIRDTWYEVKPSIVSLTELVLLLHKRLESTLRNVLSSNKFFLPSLKNQIARNIYILNGNTFYNDQYGIFLPHCFRFIGRKYLSLQNHAHSFEYYLPIQLPRIGSIIDQRFEFIRETILFHNNNLPYFPPFRPSLNYHFNL